MKKVIVSILCSAVLLSTIGGVIAQAEEVSFEENTPIEQVQTINDRQVQGRSGTINGIYYRFVLKTGKAKPPVHFNGMWLVATATHNGVNYGYYR